MRDASPPGPAAAAAAMLHALFGAARSERAEGLTDFQADAAERLRAILDLFGGAFLCDSVGLGKTHVAASIIGAAAGAGATVLVTAPAQLRSLWARQLRSVRGWTWASHTQLSRRTSAARLLRARFDLVVVDEAHGFRNAATRRYRTLARVALDARVLLITATPVNNSVLDFYNLLRLFAADDAFIASGIPDLRSEIEAAMQRRPHRLRRVARQVMVRRTRADVQRWQDAPGESRPSRLRFPAATTICPVEYDLDAVYAGHLHRICEQVAALHFAAHMRDARGLAAELLRMGMVKRLESGIAAFEQSVLRLLRLTELFRSAAQQGLLFDPARDAALAMPVDRALQLTMERLTLAAWPARLDRAHALADADRDIELLRSLLCAIDAARHNGDRKQQRLHDLVVHELADEKVVIFTEYRTTAESLRRSLQRHGGIALIHGAGARLGARRASRRGVLDRFAPLANGAAPPRAIEGVRVLIATDVISEGVNLQDARVVVSYDLPWNPVRLAQRAGRIDRLGSPHPRIEIRAFLPVRDIESVLGLLRRIRTKLRDIRTIGGDAPAPFRSPDSEPGRRTLADDPVSALREQIRSEFVRSPSAVPCAGRAVATWEHASAVLCCVESGGCATPALVRHDGTVDIDGRSTWIALARALRQPNGLPLTAEDERVSAAAEAAATRSVTARRDAKTAAASSRRIRSEALRLVRRWLGTRPGGPAAEDFRLADTVLSLFHRPRRAGAELEISAVLRLAPDDAVRRLAVLASRAPPAAPPAAPRVLASVLFRQAAPEPGSPIATTGQIPRTHACRRRARRGHAIRTGTPSAG